MPQHSSPPFFCRWLPAAFLFLWFQSLSLAQVPPALTNRIAVTSLSQQFVIHADRSPPQGLPPSLKPAGEDEIIELDPRITAVSCERIRQAVVNYIGETNRWIGKIHIFIDPKKPQRPDDPIPIVPERFPESWIFKVYLPQKCPWQKFFRAIVEAVILEIIHRNSRSQATASPLWITEGVAGLIQQEFGRQLIMEPNTFVNRVSRRADPLQFARQTLAATEALSFSDIGLIQIDQIRSTNDWAQFQASSQLLIHSLSTDPSLQGVLSRTLRTLPAHLNWQTAFLKASQPQFVTFLEIEKWWSVAIAHFRLNDPQSTWPRQRILDRLQEILVEPARYAPAPGERPTARTVPLRVMVESWDLRSQTEVFTRKAAQLRILASRAPQDLAPILFEYVAVLDRFVRNRNALGIETPSRSDIPPRLKVIIRDTVRRLEALDQRLAAAQSSTGK